MIPSRHSSLNIEVDISLLEKLKPFLDPSQPIQLRLFASTQANFERLCSGLQTLNVKIDSIDKLGNSKSSQPADSDFLANLEEKNPKEEEEEDEDEERKGVTPKSQVQHKIQKIDELKLLYMKSMKRLDDLLEDFLEDDPSLKVDIYQDEIVIIAEKKIAVKVERKLRMFVNGLIYKMFDRTFSGEKELQNFISQDFVTEAKTDLGIHFLPITPKTPLQTPSLECRLYLFVDNKDRLADLNEFAHSILTYCSFGINLNSALTQNFSEEEKNFQKKKVLQIKFDYVKRFLEPELNLMADSLRVKVFELENNNKQIVLRVEGEKEQIELFHNDLNYFFTSLRTITKISQVAVRKQTFYEIIMKNLEIFEEKKLKALNEEIKSPILLWKKFEERENVVVAVLVGFVEKDQMQVFEEMGQMVQRIINYKEKRIPIKQHGVLKKIKKPDYVQNLEHDYNLHIRFDPVQKDILVGGESEKIKALEDHLKEEELELMREKIVFYFEDQLIFRIFCKYELKNLPEYLLRENLVIDAQAIKKENNSLEFYAHPDQKPKILKIVEDLKSLISQNIETKVIEFSGQKLFKLITDPIFIKNLVNFPLDLKSFEKMTPVEIISNQQKLANLKLLPGNANSTPGMNVNEFSYKGSLKIVIHDSIFPMEIELKGLIVNIDVKGDYLEKHSEKIAETSETNRFVAKEINKLNDNSQNKKKRAEVYPIVECRNPSKSFKIMKMFYSIIKTQKIMSNQKINTEIYSMALDYNTKQIYKDNSKFTYRRNLQLITKTVLDDKYESLGIIVPGENMIDEMCAFLVEFCENTADFTNLKNLHIFTNDNKETTYLTNKFRQIFDYDNDQDNQANAKNGPPKPLQENGIISKKGPLKFKWKYLDQNNREVYFNSLDNDIINSALHKKMPQVFLAKRLNQSDICNEIYLNLRDKKATDLSSYKQIDFASYVQQNAHIRNLVNNYFEIGVNSVTLYEGNTAFYRLNFNNNTIEMISNEVRKFPLLTEETKEEEAAFFSSLGPENENISLYYAITGYSDDIAEAHAIITEASQKGKIEDEFSMPKNLEKEVRLRIFDNLKKLYVNIEMKMDDNRIWMKGTKEELIEVKSIIIEEVSKEIENLQKDIEIFPKEWLPQDKFCFSVKLKRELDKDFSMVEGLFFKTMDRKIHKIVSIKRIQNKPLYQFYSSSKSHLQNNKTIVNERLLFHGTRVVNPKSIYFGMDCGFDMRVANEGYWGTAIYFAEKAAYADTYAYVQNNKNKKILLAYVLVGDSIKLARNENTQKLKRPPFKDEKKKIELYDSVEGETQNTKVFMIYDNNRAYPAFLITYSGKV